MELVCGEYRLDLSRPRIMGILNRTPDSFSDGGLFLPADGSLDAALDHARQMVADGADMIDIGGESTRPGAQPASLEEELQRVIPLLEVLVSELDVPISVDTSKPELMAAAIQCGASMINDVNALRARGAVEIVAASPLGVCLMHMQGEPRSMQHNPTYKNVTADVLAFLQERIERCEQANIDRSRICIDPGFGFGKTLEHNLELLADLQVFQEPGLPVLVGLSRKSMFQQLTGRPVDQRLAASLAATVCAAERGARLMRVHDVAATADALAVWSAVQAEALA